MCPHDFFYKIEKKNKDRQFSSRVRRTYDLSEEEDETDRHAADPNNIGLERGKHENYWVNTFLYPFTIIAHFSVHTVFR